MGGNFRRYIAIFDQAPHSGVYLTRRLKPRLQLTALRVIAKAYRPGKVPLTYLIRLLKLGEIDAAKDFLSARGVQFTADGKSMDTKKSQITEPPEEEEEDEHRVTHAVI